MICIFNIYALYLHRNHKKSLMKTYTNQTLENVTVTRKIDGVRLHVKNGVYTSRAGNELFNLPVGLLDGIYEIYLGSFERSMSACRSHKGVEIDEKDVYMLYPEVDERLLVGHFFSIDPNKADELMQTALNDGYEGLVFHFQDVDFECFLKMKPILTIDAMILRVMEGTGKNKGKMGAIRTKYGNVGIGFTDEQRKEFFANNMQGEICEIQYMGLTPEGKLRQPRFKRLRPDLFLV